MLLLIISGTAICKGGTVINSQQNGYISIKQLQALFVFNTFGAGVIILPGLTSGLANNDGWLLIPGGVLLALLYAYLINTLSSMFPNYSFADYSKIIAGKFIGFCLSFLLALKLIFTAGMELRLLGEVIKEWMLYKTPVQVTCGAMAVLCLYIVCLGYKTRARMAEMMIYISFAALLGVFALAMLKTDFSNLQPILKTPANSMAKGSYYISICFRAVVFALLVYPFANKPMDIKKGHFKAIIFTGLLLMFITAITLAKLGFKDTEAQLWPLLQIVDTISIPGNLLERCDAFVVSFWIVSSFIAISGGMFFSADIFGRIFKAGSYKIYSLPCCIFALIVSLLPKSPAQAFFLLFFQDATVGIAFLFFIPLGLLIIAKARKLTLTQKDREGGHYE